MIKDDIKSEKLIGFQRLVRTLLDTCLQSPNDPDWILDSIEGIKVNIEKFGLTDEEFKTLIGHHYYQLYRTINNQVKKYNSHILQTQNWH